MKYFFPIFTLLILFFLTSSHVHAYNKDDAINAYTQELNAMGMTEGAGEKAESDVEALIESMESDQYDVQAAYDNTNKQVTALVKTSSRRDAALEALDAAEGPAEDFAGMDAEDHLRVEPSIAGTPPYVAADDTFSNAQDAANSAIGAVRRILIAPDQPGSVPAGDIVSDFIPQIIRQLFRFAWLAVLVALTISGVMLVMAHDDDEKLTKAKQMIYYSLIGFAFIALAFALVKAVTDIDFFRFI